MSQSADSSIHSDPVLSVIRTFGYLNRMIVSTALSVISWEEFVPSVATHVKETNAQMVIVPWSTRVISDTLSTETNLVDSAPPRTSPFDALFGQKQSGSNEAIVHSQFIRRVFTDIPADVALFVDRGLPQASEGQLGSTYLPPILRWTG
ncbi:hypothetical protein QCA50_000835 [Cerrena zonata]|uniref:Uncharacterized protein n=1 Tax=Cerrena zonata TaxID=2478898 RepID=A0AAW0GXF3_9APHY